MTALTIWDFPLCESANTATYRLACASECETSCSSPDTNETDDFHPVRPATVLKSKAMHTSATSLGMLYAVATAPTTVASVGWRTEGSVVNADAAFSRSIMPVGAVLSEATLSSSSRTFQSRSSLLVPPSPKRTSSIVQL